MHECLDTDDTITAIASTRGGVRGIVRLSGPHVVRCLKQCAHLDSKLAQSPGARRTSSQFQLPFPIGAIDCDIYVWPAGRSYTNQPSAEVHLSGSAPLLEAVVSCLCQNGARLARPGEFTLRAFLGGRLDLTQAEAVLGVIDSGTREELDTALEQLAGGLAGPLHNIRESLLNLLADLEAGLDFVEEDIQFVTDEHVAATIQACRENAENVARQIAARTDRRSFVRAVLVGPANAGKSTLFNRLTETDGALVADQAGTTRDYVTANVCWAGVDIELVDTAGFQLAADTRRASEPSELDLAGHQRREEILAAADLTIVCYPANELADVEFVRTAGHGPQLDLVVATKCDLMDLTLPTKDLNGLTVLETSAIHGIGLDTVRLAIAKAACERQRAPVMEGTAVRCSESLRGLLEMLASAEEACQQNFGEEIVAAEIRGALYALATIVGSVYTDDILDRLFSRFCIGK